MLMMFSKIFSQSEMRFIGNNTKQKISFETNNNLIVIPILLNGKKLSFILDSGASRTIIFGVGISDSLVLNDSKKILLRGLGSGEPIEGISSKGNIIKIKNILGINQTVYVIFGDKFDLSAKMGKTIHGIIGYDILKNFITKIDYRKRQITFYKPSKFQIPNSKYKKFDITFHHKKPYIDALIKITDTSTHLAKLLIDTGNSDALWLFEDKRNGLIIQNKFFKDHIGEGLSGSIDGKRSKIKSFNIGPYTFNNPTTAFLDSTATSYARAYDQRNGSIGSRVLNRFTIILDYPNQKIYLKKTKSFDKEFKYNRAGIELSYIGKTLIRRDYFSSQTIIGNQQVNETNSVRFIIDYQYEFKPVFGIHKIRPGSPADIAGLKVNDIINKINGKPAYEYKLKDIVNLFYGAEGSTIKLLVERRNALFYYEFKLKKPL
jgi:hypothetical protein